MASLRDRLSRPGVPEACLIIVIALFYLLTFRAGHRWGDDFAQYILHARNIAEQRGYADTGYVYDPACPSIGPIAYPPLFPLALAPIYKVFGLNLTAMKTENTLFFIATLALVSTAFSKVLTSSFERIAFLVILGMNPFLWDFKDEILSDTMFVFVVYCGLVLGNHLSRQNTRPLKYGPVVLGIILCMAYGTRSAGVALSLALVVRDVLSLHRLSRSTCYALFVFACGAAVQLAVVGGTQAYFDQLAHGPGVYAQVITYNAVAYLNELTLLWTVNTVKASDPSSFARIDIVGFTLFLLATGLAVAGYYRRIRQEVGLLEIFPATYLLTIFAWPEFQGLRLLLPVVPLYVLYSCIGARSVPRLRWWPRLGQPAMVVLMAGAAFTYGVRFAHADFGPFPDGVATPEASTLFAYIRSSTRPDDVVVFSKPRALALFTGRRAGAYCAAIYRPPYLEQKQPAIATYLDQVDAAEVIATTAHPPPGGLPEDGRLWSEWAAASATQAMEVNQAFVAYRVPKA